METLFSAPQGGREERAARNARTMHEAGMTHRGTFGFQIRSDGRLADSDHNLELLRKLFRDGSIIHNRFGPGNPGDFDLGAWHILSHLAGGSAVLEAEGRKAWIGIIHKGFPDVYEAAIVFQDAGTNYVFGLKTDPGKATAAKGALLGFIEGSSAGHVLARNIQDPPGSYNGWLRQDFDHSVWSRKKGGTVWEHWCTTRDLRQANIPCDSLLRAYLTLAATCGGLFIAALARGRRAHEHPLQLCALTRAGLLTEDEAACDITPRPIAGKVQRLLYQARPADYIRAAEGLDWPRGKEPSYFMFKRNIGLWSTAPDVRADLMTFAI